MSGFMETHSTLLERRTNLLGPSVPTFYEDPVHIVRGKGVWLWDNSGKKYLDCYNNVPHVGHCHPKVVEAIYNQSSTLNTHTRYLHEGILDYVDHLTSKFSEKFTSAIIACSGSEANDVALRMAQVISGNKGILCTDNTYHGNTSLVSQIGSRTEPIGGYSNTISQIPSPVGTKTCFDKIDENENEKLAGIVQEKIDAFQESGVGLACLIICPFFANEGFPTLHKGFLEPIIAKVRSAGGLVIADEVQPGFGRVGNNWWGHQLIGFEPDIITLGKPMGNGYPVAAIVSSNENIGIFRKRFSYFNTFGGNPVAMAAAQSTLKVIEEENLVQHAYTVGQRALHKLNNLVSKYDCLGVTRGSGLFFGAEVCDREDNPDAHMTKLIVNSMREKGVLINSLGRHKSILKIRPPLSIENQEIDLLINTLDDVLDSLARNHD